MIENHHILEFENNENSKIRMNDDKDLIKKIDEKEEAMNNTIATIDPTKLKKDNTLVLHQIISCIKLKL